MSYTQFSDLINERLRDEPDLDIGDLGRYRFGEDFSYVLVVRALGRVMRVTHFLVCTADLGASLACGHLDDRLVALAKIRRRQGNAYAIVPAPHGSSWKRPWPWPLSFAVTHSYADRPEEIREREVPEGSVLREATHAEFLRLIGESPSEVASRPPAPILWVPHTCVGDGSSSVPAYSPSGSRPAAGSMWGVWAHDDGYHPRHSSSALWKPRAAEHPPADFFTWDVSASELSLKAYFGMDLGS